MSVATCSNLGIKDSIPKSIPSAGKSLGEPNITRGRKALVVHNPLTPVSMAKGSQQSSSSSFRLVGRSVGKAKVGKENNGVHGCNRLNTQVLNHAMGRHRGEGVDAQYVHCKVKSKRLNTDLLVTFVYGLYSVPERRSMWDDLASLGAFI
ncbi:hypothetical protein Dimus_015890 [Dionaea muscipula]